MPQTRLGILYVLPHLILKITWRGNFQTSCFNKKDLKKKKDKGSEVQRLPDSHGIMTAVYKNHTNNKGVQIKLPLKTCLQDVYVVYGIQEYYNFNLHVNRKRNRGNKLRQL